MKKYNRILHTLIGSTLAAAFLSGCSEVFISTDAPELIIPSSQPEVSVNDENSYHQFSSHTPDISSVLPESSAPDTSLPTASGEFSRHPRFSELEQQFSYTSDGKICLSDAEQKFTDKALFVGDSICRGFSAYKITKPQSVLAAGTVAARNFFEKDFFYNGQETSYKDLLAKTKPEYIFLWMGMNDVNMTSAAEYCKNYEKIISLTLSDSSAKVCVCAISPINSDFTDNGLIDEFNLAIQQYIPNNFSDRVSYIDFAYLLKDSSNMLSKGLDSGDGIHLAPECYYAAISEICSQLKLTE